MDRRKKLILELGTGVIIGTAAGLLLPPKPGVETGHFVANKPKVVAKGSALHRVAVPAGN